MALLSKRDEADDGESAASAKGVASRLKALEERRFSGAVEISVKGSSAQAEIYLYEGGIYSVHLDGYGPVLMDRLATQGILDGARWNELATIFGPHRSHPRVGPMAVEQEWMTLDELVNVHQEFLIAMLGAVLAVPKARVERETSATTGAFCSLPQDLPRLLRLVQGRQQRIAGAWAAMEARCEPAELVLRRGGAAVPTNLDHHEFVAMLDTVDGERSLDDVAAALGLTRGEAIRAASLLVLAGALVVDHDLRAQQPTDRLFVPEAWGRSLTPRSQDEPPAPTAPPAPVGVVAGAASGDPLAWLPRPTGPAVPTVVVPVREVEQPAPEPEYVPEPQYEPEREAEEPVAEEPAPEPEPEPEQPGAWVPQVEQYVPEPQDESVQYVPEPAPVPQYVPELQYEPVQPEAQVEQYEPEPYEPVQRDAAAAPAPDDSESAADALLQRHRRLQEATEQALLLEQLLSESIVVEREALERSSVIRQRLRATLAQVASLTSSTADAPPVDALAADEEDDR